MTGKQTVKIAARRLQGASGWLERQVVIVRGGLIISIASGNHGDISCDTLTLGLMDEHQHGALGFDAANPDADKAREWLVFLGGMGVTDILYTIGSIDISGLRPALAFARDIMERQNAGELGGAKVRGVHMEGPFINPARVGAMNPSALRPADPGLYRRMVDGYEDIVKLITIAPEIPGALDVARLAQSHGARVQAGHTDATYDEAARGFDAGFDGLTHTFNACRPIHHREGGVIVAAMLDERVICEAVCDLVHVDAQVLRTLIRVKGADRVAVISDSTPTAGLPDGAYHFGNHPVIVRDGRNYTESGGIAGSAKQAADGLRNLIGAGIDEFDAVRMATVTPLRRFGLPHAIEPGAKVSLVGWNKGFEPALVVQ